MYNNNFALEFRMTNEVETEGKSLNRWKKLSLKMKSQFIKVKGINGLNLRLQLTTAICLVGSHDVKYFLMVFKIMSKFDMGECHWVIQEELLRHSAILRIERALQRSGNSKFMSHTLIDDLLEVFPKKYAPIYILNSTVKSKYRKLRVNMFKLIVEMNRTTNPKIMFEKYKLSYPLESFTAWFLKWAQPLITNINELVVNNRLHKP